MSTVMLFAQTSALAALLLIGQLPEDAKDDGKSRAAWGALFDRTAESYQIDRDAEHRQSLRLRAEPVYKWTAASAGSDVHGAVYVWTDQGCAEAVVCFWRRGQSLVHEAHALSPEVLWPVRTGDPTWRPTAGLPRQRLEDAPAPAEKPAARLAQMRRLGASFSAHSEADNGERRELRLLSAPLFRYESSDPDVIDGALFAFVCSVGSDPEAYLLLEARRTADGPRWHYALARFSHLHLFANYEGRPVWKSVRSAGDNADGTYYLVFSPPVAASELRDAQ